MIRPPPKAKSKLEETIEIAQWPRNSRGQTIRVSLRSYGGHPLLDIRTWWTGDDGAVHPKGLPCRLKDVPCLAVRTRDAVAAIASGRLQLANDRLFGDAQTWGYRPIEKAAVGLRRRTEVD
jgi:hypothetical protein